MKTSERLMAIGLAFGAMISGLAASGASVQWHSVDEVNPIPPPLFAVTPAAPTDLDTISFVARADGQIYGNDCWASATTGDPQISVDPAGYTITVWFSAPNTNQLCSDEFLPVMGIDGQAGPLAAGLWQFRLVQSIGVSVFHFTVTAQAPSPPPPPLSIRPWISGGLLLSWPTNPVACAVEFNTDLSSTNWQTMTNNPLVVSGLNLIEVTHEAGSRFFRLRRLSP